jgi:hypothetical protein
MGRNFGGGGGQLCGHPGRQDPKGGKKNILNKNSIYCAQHIVNYSAE